MYTTFGVHKGKEYYIKHVLDTDHPFQFQPNIKGEVIGVLDLDFYKSRLQPIMEKKKEAVLALLGDDPKAQEWSGEFLILHAILGYKRLTKSQRG
jgi:hypothetical protein